MKNAFLSILLCLLNLYCSSQSFNWKNREIKSDTDLLKTSIFISLNTLPVTSKFWHYGVGFFYYSIKFKKLYLVTNKHVTENLDTLIMVVKERNKNLSDTFTIFSVSHLQKICKYFKGANNTDEDLVLIDLEAVQFKSELYSFKCFTDENMPPESISQNLPIDSKIYNINYLRGVAKFPFVINCTFATPYFLNYNDKKEFCLSGNIIAGCSGSPIILHDYKNGWKYYLLGIDRFGQSEPSNITNKLTNKETQYETEQLLFVNQCIKSEQLIKLINEK